MGRARERTCGELKGYRWSDGSLIERVSSTEELIIAALYSGRDGSRRRYLCISFFNMKEKLMYYSAVRVPIITLN